MAKHYKVYIDENMPIQLAHGLNLLQQPQNAKESISIEVLSIKETFGKGALDEDWIPIVGGEKGIVITQDFRIHSQRHQRELYIKSGVAILFLNPPSNSGFSYWDMVKKVILEWDNIKKIIKKNKVPFAFRATSKKSFEEMS